MANSGHGVCYNRGLDQDFEKLAETKLLQLMAEAVCAQLALFVGHQHLHNSTGGCCAQRRLGPGLTPSLCSCRLSTVSLSLCFCVCLYLSPGLVVEVEPRTFPHAFSLNYMKNLRCHWTRNIRNKECTMS